MCGVIKIEWIDDSDNPKYANYFVPSLEDLLFQEANRLVGFAATIVREGGIIKDEDIQFYSKLLQFEFKNLSDVLESAIDLRNRILLPDNSNIARLCQKLIILDKIIEFFSNCNNRNIDI